MLACHGGNEILDDRWLSPDSPRLRSGCSTGGDISNPQSLNRYGYVLNNPNTLTAPSGLVTIMLKAAKQPSWGMNCDFCSLENVLTNSP